MSAPYDGSEFVGIDEEAINADGSASQPWDAYLDAATASDEQWLLEVGHQIAWTPLTNNAGDYNDKAELRAYTSLAYTTILCLPWYYVEDQDAVSVGLIARGATESTDLDGVQLVLQRLTADLSLPISSIAQGYPNTESLTPQYQDNRLTMPVSNQAADALGALVLLCAGAPNDSDYDVTLGGGDALSTQIYRAGDTNFYADTTSSRPNVAALDLQFTRLTGAGGGNVDHAFYPQHFGTSDGEIIGVAASTGPVPNQLARRGMSYLQVKGASIRQTYEDTTRPDARALAAKKPLLGEVAATHAIRQEMVYTRPRPVYIGPAGQIPAPEASEWPDGYTYRYRRVYGDDVTTQSLNAASIQLETDAPKILVLAYIAPLHLFPTAILAPDAELDAITPQITWEHTITVRQLEDGDASWSAATTLGTTTQEITHAHRPYQLDSMLATCEAAVRYPYSGDAAGLGYAFREGQLTIADFTSLDLISFEVELSGYDASTAIPLRVDFDTIMLTPTDAAWGQVPDTILAADDTINARNIDTLALVLCGITIWEIPQ